MDTKYLNYEGLSYLLTRLYNGTIEVGRAIADLSGNVITETYATKSNLSTAQLQLLLLIVNLLSLTNTLSGNVNKISTDNYILSGIVYNDEMRTLENNFKYNTALGELSGKISNVINGTLISELSGKVDSLFAISDQLYNLQVLVNLYKLQLDATDEELSGRIENNSLDILDLSGRILSNTDKIEYLSGILKDVDPDTFVYIEQVSGLIADLYDKVSKAVTTDLSGLVYKNRDDIEYLSGILKDVNPDVFVYIEQVSGLINDLYDKVSKAVTTDLSGLVYKNRDDIEILSGLIKETDPSIYIFMDKVSGQIQELYDDVSKAITTNYDWMSGQVVKNMTDIEWLSGLINKIDPNTLQAIVNLSSEISGAIQSSKENSLKIEDLSSKVDTNTNNIGSLSGNISEISGSLNQLSGNIDTVKKDILLISGKLLGHISNSNTDILVLSGKQVDIENTVSGLVEQYNSISGEIYQELNNLSGSLSKDIQDTESRLKDSINTLSGLLDSNTDLQSGVLSSISEISGSISNNINNINILSGEIYNNSNNIIINSNNIDALSGRLAAIEDSNIDSITSGEIYDLWTNIFK